MRRKLEPPKGVPTKGIGLKGEDKPNTSPTKQHYVGVNQLIDLFYEYCEDVKANPILEEDYVGGAGIKVEKKKQRPYTKQGFFVFVKHRTGFNVSHYFKSSQQNDYSAYKDVIEEIELTIADNQISGGMVGIFNARMSSLMQGLVEKTESKNDNKITVTVEYADRSKGSIE
jgi:hypothetical protein